MRILDLIEKKKQGLEHTKEEINFIIDSLQAGIIQDYQLSAWLMAIYFQGMSENETVYLTEAIIESGQVVNFTDELAQKTLDLYSTGGVGDKVGVILIPLLAAADIPTIKLTGKGLGYTQTTIDKLESIPGFNTDIAVSDIVNHIQNHGFVISSQIKHVTPITRTLHVLRYTSGTMNALPLIAASVVSKKIATGANNIIVDIKYGSGALIKNVEDAEKLAKLIINIGKRFDKDIIATITSLEEPIGRTVGNSIEIIESIEFLKGNIKSGDLAELVYEFASIALIQVGKYSTKEEAVDYLKTLISSGKALDKCREIIIKQKGNDAVIDNYDKFPLPKYKIKYIAEQTGYVNKIDAYQIAYGCRLLGSIRDKHTDKINKGVGIFLNKKTGEFVNEGETLYTIYSDQNNIDTVKKCFTHAYQISEIKEPTKNIVYKIIRNN